MDKEDSLQFVQERLRHIHSLIGEFRGAEPPRVRRRFAVPMAKGEHRTFERVDESVLVCCSSGSLWITHDGDPKDLVLGAGEHYWAQRPQAMHVFALQPCVVEIQFDDDIVEH